MAWASSGSILDQGAIVSGVIWPNGGNNPLGIVLTNTCDFAQDKASFILVAALVDASDVFKESKQYQDIIGDGVVELSGNKTKSLKNYLEGYIHNANITRYFFIDPTPAFDSDYLLADFQNLTTVKWDSRDQLTVEGVLPSPFREQCVTRFAAYTSRIGVDRVDTGRLQEILSSIAQPVRLNF